MELSDQTQYLARLHSLESFSDEDTMNFETFFLMYVVCGIEHEDFLHILYLLEDLQSKMKQSFHI